MRIGAAGFPGGKVGEEDGQCEGTWPTHIPRIL